MSQRSGACHVAEIKRKHSGRVYRYFLLRRTYREDGKVKHETLANLSHLPESAIDALRRALKGEHLVGAADAFEIIRSRPHGGVAATLGTLRQLKLAELVASRRSSERDVVEGLIAARVLKPASKLATARAFRAETLESTLGELLGLSEVDEEVIYAAMDWLLARQVRIESALARRHLAEGTLALYDVTSTYFEGRKCPLAKLGHNRDGKVGKAQIVIGLLTNQEGCPIAVRVFEGNTGDPTTLAPQIVQVRDQFRIRRVVIVGDRGMITSARIREDLAGVEGLDWITALRAPSIQGLVREGHLQLSIFDERDLAEIESPAFPGERLVACRNPMLAAERARKRRELLEATQRELQKIQVATERPTNPLRGSDKIGLRVGKIIGRFKMQKHFRLHITDESFRFERDEERIAEEAALDGIYVIRTSVPQEDLTEEDTVRAYKALSRVERAFRSMKTVDLQVRPIYHWKSDRVRAHVLICMLAYYVEWHMRRRLAPILFDDHDKDSAESERQSVVAPAKRSKAAETKARTKRTEDGLPVQSFRSLLHDLGTLTMNRIRMSGHAGAEFDMASNATPLQQRAFDLLDVSPTL